MQRQIDAIDRISAGAREAMLMDSVAKAFPPPPLTWPASMPYVHAKSGKIYTPHHDEEAAWMANDVARYLLAKGGEGSGKSTSGVIRTLKRLRVGCDGIMLSPDFEHFKKSLLPLFKSWCPWDYIVPSQQRRRADEWDPNGSFTFVFKNSAKLYCGGIEDPSAWDGPNVNFAHLDEAHRCRTAGAIKVLDGRVRVPGPNGEKPQMWLTTITADNWLYEYFGPYHGDGPDPLAAFKADSAVLTLRTEDNEKAGNIEAGFTQMRAQTLTAQEARIRLGGEWERVADTDTFVLPEEWDALYDPALAGDPVTGRTAEGCKWTRWVSRALTGHMRCAFALDGSRVDDTTVVLGVAEHPTRPGVQAVVYVLILEPTQQTPVDDDSMVAFIGDIWRDYSSRPLRYDATEMRDIARKLLRDRGVRSVIFSQQGDRVKADTGLRNRIRTRRIAHGGFDLLTKHVKAANAKAATTDEKDDRNVWKRIVKRRPDLKIDACVTLSMASQVFAEKEA